ncbi:hypothetical protein AwDysgo_09250 [Bacteroidales bacterium]|nr:hypothetical protein AwDysgo_09250 [Bacteroidales bacterium]
MSCSSVYKSGYEASNRFIIGDAYNYYNDSLKVSLDLFGDYRFRGKCTNILDYHNSIDRKTYRLDKKLINTYFPKLNVGKDNFIFRASTLIEPYYHSAFFCIPNKFVSNSDSIILNIPKRTLIHYFQRDGSAYFHLLTLDKQHGDSYIEILQMEAEHIRDGINFGSEYKITSPPNPFEIYSKAMADSGNYLSAISAHRAIEPFFFTENEKWNYRQVGATYNAFIQNNATYDDLLSKIYRPSKTVSIQTTKYDTEALNYLKQEIEGKQLVMINEQHWQPKHRYLGNMLLEYIYSQGFRYLAIEAIWKGQDSLNIRKYPTQKLGLYTKDPQFGNLIRNALRMGYEIIEYEQMGENRDFLQAKNIYDKTFKENKDAKVLVWAGIGHINEEKSEDPKMAYHLKEMSKIDPLTIEQTSGDPYASRLGKHYLAINDDTTKKGGQYDVRIYNNIPEYDFRIIPDVDTKTTTIPLSEMVKNKIKQHGRLLLMVYDKTEFAEERFNAVPLINYLMSDNKSPNLELPPGSYTAIIKSPTTAIIEELNLMIE